MADPNSFDDLTKVGTSAGAGGLVVALSALVGKFLTSSKLDEMRQQNSAQSAQLADLGAKMTALLERFDDLRQAHRDLDAASRFADLEARLSAVEKALDRAVAQ